MHGSRAIVRSGPPILWLSIGTLALAPAVSATGDQRDARVASAVTENRPPAPASLPRLGDKEARRVEALEADIRRLREESRYADAIVPAAEVLTVRRREQGELWWATADARRLVETLEHVVQLSAAELAEFAEVDRAASDLEELYVGARYEEAIVLADHQLTVRRRLLGERHIEVADALYDLGLLRYDTGRYDEAEGLHRQALEIYRERSGEEHPSVARCLAALVPLLELKGDVRSAERTCREVLAMRRRLLGEEHADVIATIRRLGYVLRRQGYHSQAERHLRRALQLDRARSSPDDLQLARSLESLGRLLHEKGEYDEAERLFREALARRRRLQVGDHPEVAYALGRLGGLLQSRGDTAAARPVLEESLAILRRLFGDGSPDVATAELNLASYFREVGNHVEAEVRIRAALAIYRKLLGDSHPRVATAMQRLAGVLATAGEYSAAERVLAKAGVMMSRLYGNDGARMTNHLASAGRVAYAKGDLVEAERLFREVLARQRSLLGDDTPAIAEMLSWLSAVLTTQGRLEEAESLEREALAMYRERLGPDHVYVGVLLSRLADKLADRTGTANLREAESKYAEARSLVRRSGRVGLHIVSSRYADFLRTRRGRPREAAGLYAEAIEEIDRLREAGAGDELDRARALSELSKWDAYGGMARAQIEAFDWRDPSAFGPDIAYGYLERGRGRGLLEILDRGGRGFDDRFLAGIGRENGDNFRVRAATLRQRERDAKAARLSAERQIAMTRHDAGLSEEQKDECTAALAERLEDARGTERRAVRELLELARHEFGSVGVRPMAADEIAARLEPGERLLTYDVGRRDSILLVVTPGGAPVRAFKLRWPDGRNVDAASLDVAVRDVVAGISREAEAGERGTNADPRPESALWQALVPAELRDEVAGAARVFVVPDGPLHCLPLETLLVDVANRTRWLDTFPPIVYGPSGTVLASQRDRAARRRAEGNGADGPSLVALGDPIFSPAGPPPPAPDHGVLLARVQPGAAAAAAGLQAGDILLAYAGHALDRPGDLEALVTDAEVTSPVPVTAWRDGVLFEREVAPGALGADMSQATMPHALTDHRFLTGSDLERRITLHRSAVRGRFGGLAPLPGTGVEVRAIGALFHRHGRGDDRSVRILTGPDATTSRLYAVTDGPRYLHLATHGLPEGGARVLESALATTAPETPTPEDDGFLCLGDLLSRWRGKLQGTELVTLSGCRTGRGRLESGEGFVALTWGFLYAGAESVVASLWKVDDTATALLMVRFYENLLGGFDTSREVGGRRFPPGRSMPKADALCEAKSWLRNLSRTEAQKAMTGLAAATVGRGAVFAPVETTPSEFPGRPYADPFYWGAFVLLGDGG